MNEMTPPAGPDPGKQMTTSAVASADALMTFIGSAVLNPNLDILKFEALMRMQRELIAEHQKGEFNRAMALVQAEMTPVTRDANNEQTHSKYARLETIDAMMRPVYSSHGFSLTFNNEKPESEGGVRISCLVTHEGGFERQYALESSLDSMGPKGQVNKTPLHALGSTVSYLRRYLTAMIFHIVLINDDDDGNAGGNAQRGKAPPPRPPRQMSWVEQAEAALVAERNGVRWLNLLSNTLGRAETEADVDAIGDLEGVKEGYYAAPMDTRKRIDTMFADARVRLRGETGTGKPAETKAAVKPKTTPRQTEEPAFEAILVDASGTPDLKAHTDARSFAEAFMAHYAKAKPSEAAALLEYNADAIDEARQYPRAAPILAAIDEPPENTSDPIPEITPVEPPVERGKISWVSYVKLLKADLDQTVTDHVLPWVTAQRATLATVPMGQRVLAIQAISKRFGVDNITPPAWLGELMRAPASAGQPATGTVGATADERWAMGTIGDIHACTTPEQFRALVESGAVQKVMARLKRENSALFDHVDAAFLQRHNAFNPPPQGRVGQE